MFQLRVKPNFAYLTHNTSTFSGMDPYVECRINKQTQKTQTCQKGKLQPRWNDTLKFNIINMDDLEIIVYDKNSIGSDKVGKAFIDITDFCIRPNVQHTQSITLFYAKPHHHHHRNNKTTKYTLQTAGKINVTFVIQNMNQNLSQNRNLNMPQNMNIVNQQQQNYWSNQSPINNTSNGQYYSYPQYY